MPFKPAVGQKVHYYDHSRNFVGPYEATVEAVNETANGPQVVLSVQPPPFKVDNVSQPVDVHNPHVHGSFYVEEGALTNGNKLVDEEMPVQDPDAPPIAPYQDPNFLAQAHAQQGAPLTINKTGSLGKTDAPFPPEQNKVDTGV